MKSGVLESMPTCGLPDEMRSPSQRMFSCRNRLTLGKRYEVIDRDGSNVIVLDDDGNRASFNGTRLVDQQ